MIRSWVLNSCLIGLEFGQNDAIVFRGLQAQYKNKQPKYVYHIWYKFEQTPSKVKKTAYAWLRASIPEKSRVGFYIYISSAWKLINVL